MLFALKHRTQALTALFMAVATLMASLAAGGAALAQATQPAPAPLMPTPVPDVPRSDPAPPAPASPFISYVGDILPQRQRDLFVMRLDGSDKKQITSGFNVWFASWRPDGKQLAVTTEAAELYTVNPDGSNLRRIAVGAFSPPFWSPDGHFIAYVGGERFGAPVARGNLRIIPAVGGTPWVVPGGEDIPSLPPGAAAVAWSGDGTRIACGWPGRILHVAGGPGAPVGVAALKGQGKGMFVVAGGWAPDGKHLAVTDGINYGILDMATGNFVTIAKSFKQPGIARPGVGWSAGLKKVAYVINSEARDGQRLFLADFDGSNPKLILSAPHHDVYHGEVSDYGPPFFSGDSKTMLVRVSRTTSKGGTLLFTHESWLVRTDGSGGEKLVDGFNANWRPNPKLDLPDPAFWFQWRIADLPVANKQVGRPYLWGPTAIFSGTETLATPQDVNSAQPVQDPAQLQLQVVYFDKGRMELHFPRATQPTPYLVTGGALAKELVTGQIYNSLNVETSHAPEILVAGDDPNDDAPTYATFNKLGAGTDAGKAEDRTGRPVDSTLARDGTIRQDADLGNRAKIGAFILQTGHNIPDVFLGYFKGQSWDWISIAGYPISEPYWVHVNVAGEPHNVLVQVFERRTVTYDPSAPEAYRVQFGNVGRHYYNWRYGGK